MRKRNLWILGVLLALFSCNGKTPPTSEPTPQKPQAPVTISEAIMALTDSIQMDSTDAMLYLHRAQAYLAKDQVGAAMIDINKSLQLNPNNIDTYLLLANVYYMLGDEGNINVTLNRAAEIDPFDSRPLVKLAELNLLQQNYNLAGAYIDKALKVNAYNPKAYFVRGMYCIVAQQDTVNALKNFQLASEQDSYFYDPVEQICRIYAVQQPPYALDYIRKAQRQFPDHSTARYELALYLQDHGYPEEALMHYDTLLKQQPENYYVLYNVAYVNLEYLNDNEKALEYFDKALEINPEYTDAYYNKGLALERMGQYRQAEEIYKDILKSHPDYQLAISALNYIQNQIKD